MSAMSTPVNQLPQQVNPNMVPKLDEDQEVLDVIKGMEKEFQTQHQAPPVQMAMPTPVVQAPAPHVAPSPSGAVVTQLYPGAAKKMFGFDLKIAQRAALMAAIALLVFYQDDLSSLYARFSVLDKFAPYDKLVRCVVLVAVYYIIIWKFGF